MTERETLLAEIAALETVHKIVPNDGHIELALEQRQARLAEIDAERDYEAWRPALQAYMKAAGWPDLTCDPLDETDKATIRGLIAAFAKAPPMGERQPEVCVTEEQSASLHKAMVASFDDVAMPIIPPMGEAEWIEWHGGNCPLPKKTMIEVRFRDGGTARAWAGHWYSSWLAFERGPAIIAYRIVGEQP
jgi:hypothetical protein